MMFLLVPGLHFLSFCRAHVLLLKIIIKGYFEIWKWKKHFSYLSKEKDPTNSIPVFMNDGIKQFSISPAGSEIFTPYSSITLCCLLRPQ